MISRGSFLTLMSFPTNQKTTRAYVPKYLEKKIIHYSVLQVFFLHEYFKKLIKYYKINYSPPIKKKWELLFYFQWNTWMKLTTWLETLHAIFDIDSRIKLNMRIKIWSCDQQQYYKFIMGGCLFSNLIWKRTIGNHMEAKSNLMYLH